MSGLAVNDDRFLTSHFIAETLGLSHQDITHWVERISGDHEIRNVSKKFGEAEYLVPESALDSLKMYFSVNDSMLSKLYPSRPTQGALQTNDLDSNGLASVIQAMMQQQESTIRTLMQDNQKHVERIVEKSSKTAEAILERLERLVQQPSQNHQNNQNPQEDLKRQVIEATDMSPESFDSMWSEWADHLKSQYPKQDDFVTNQMIKELIENTFLAQD